MDHKGFGSVALHHPTTNPTNATPSSSSSCSFIQKLDNDSKQTNNYENQNFTVSSHSKIPRTPIIS
jgi:hypothetical protein